MHFLKSGCALILTLWPPDVIHGTIPIGSNQKYGSAKFVDQKMLTSPDEFELDLSYAYRAINLNSWTDAHYIGLKMDGWDIIQRVLPSGACIARHWGPLASLEALVRHFQSVFATEDIVAGIVETHHILYCKMEKGALCSLKLSDRASLKNTEDIGKTLKNFDLSKNPSIYMIDLTANPAETDLFCLQASEQEAVDMRMVEKKELSQSLKMLTPADSFSFLPIALIQGGKNAKFHA